MKLLLILGLVLVGVWLWRSSRETPRQRPPPANATPQEMVRCAHCGLHLPASEAVQGKKGRYCSPEHLLRAES